MLAEIILTSAVILSPNPDAVKPVARPICLVNLDATTIVYAGDVKSVTLSPDKSTVQVFTTGKNVTAVKVPANVEAEAYRTSLANNIRESWTTCKR